MMPAPASKTDERESPWKCGDELLVSVADDARVFGALGLGLHERLDVIVGSLLGKLASQIDDRDVRGRHAESHASELAVEGGNDLADRLGRASRRRNDVLASAAAAAPILAGRAINGLLGGSGGVDGGHQALDDAV